MNVIFPQYKLIHAFDFFSSANVFSCFFQRKTCPIDGQIKKGRQRKQSKMKELSQEKVKKARAEKVFLKRELHGLLKAEGSVLSTMFLNICQKERSNYQLLPLHTELSSDVLTISNQNIGEGSFGIVSIGHIKTLDSFCAVKEGKHSHHFNVIFEARVLQSLTVNILPTFLVYMTESQQRSKSHARIIKW